MCLCVCKYTWYFISVTLLGRGTEKFNKEQKDFRRFTKRKDLKSKVVCLKENLVSRMSDVFRYK